MDKINLRNDKYFNVINISQRNLSNHELDVLSKGLSFCPVPYEVNELKLKMDLDAYFRRLRLQEFFCNSQDVSTGNFSSNQFRKPSAWTPPCNRDKFLESYITVVKEEVFNCESRHYFHNLSQVERNALRDLKIL